MSSSVPPSVQPPAPGGGYLPPGPGYPQPPAKRGVSCWVIGLIVLAVSVPLLGVLSALAIYGVQRYLAAAKTSEAKATVASIALRAEGAHARRSTELGESDARALCGSAAPVPAVVPSGTKYASAASDWESGDEDNGWRCLRFSMSSPQYYQYYYLKGVRDPDGFEAVAVGDLDADGVHSSFSRAGRVEGGSLRMASQIQIENENE